MTKKKIDYTQSSGNVFEDLNIPNSEEVLAKAELMRQIGNVIKEKQLTQEQAALMLNIDQPKVSALMNGKLEGFSLERLLRFLNDLGQDITIEVKPKARSQKKGFISVNVTQPNEEVLIKNR